MVAHLNYTDTETSLRHRNMTMAMLILFVLFTFFVHNLPTYQVRLHYGLDIPYLPCVDCVQSFSYRLVQHLELVD